MTGLKAAFWALYARSYDVAWDSGFTSHVAASIHRHIRADSRVVDLGTGTGLLSRGLRDHGCHVVGVDTSGAMLSRARQRQTLDEHVQADAADTGLPTAFADVVLCGNLLHLHPTPARVIDEAVRIAKPGALLAWTSPAPGTTGSKVWSADRHHGRSIVAATLAYLVRADIARLARISGVRLASPERVREALTDSHQRHGLTVEASFAVDRVQVVTLSTVQPARSIRA